MTNKLDFIKTIIIIPLALMASESIVIIIIVVIIIIIIIHLAQGFGCSHADLYPKGAIQNK